MLIMESCCLSCSSSLTERSSRPRYRAAAELEALGRKNQSSRNLQMLYKIPLILEPQSEGGFTVTSPILPELVTEGDTIEEVLANVQDALRAVIEAYQDLGRSLPSSLQLPDTSSPVWLETLVATS
jgi:antitoxin HicB